MNNRILYCDDSFAIVNKIAGEVCSFEDGKENEEFYLPKVFKNLISEKLGYTPEIIECVNRIDKPVSGIVILALSKDANKELSLQLKFHKILNTCVNFYSYDAHNFEQNAKYRAQS